MTKTESRVNVGTRFSHRRRESNPNSLFACQVTLVRHGREGGRE